MNKAFEKKLAQIKEEVLAMDNSKLRRLIFDLEEMFDYADDIERAYVDENGVYRWLSSKNVPPTEILKCWNLDDKTFKRCEEARKEDNAKAIADYRKAMENYEPSDEELFEMRAAFGEGETIVNVITGKEIQL